MLKDYPVIKLTVFLAAGFLLQYNFNIPIIYPLISFFLLILIIVLKKYIHNISYVYSLLPLIIGIIYFGINQNYKDNFPFKEKYVKKAVIYGKINDISLINEDKLKLEIVSDSIKTQTTNYNKYKYIVNIKTEDPKKLKYYYNYFQIGYCITFKGNILEPPGLRTFNGFNYKQYLYNKNISGIIFVTIDKNKIITTSTNIDYFKNVIYKARKSIDDKINLLYNKQSSALVRGLVLGDRSNIDDELKENFIQTGVVHVLAVSGLHVGLIIFIFFFLFARFNIILRNILTLIGIIFYFYLTGCQPSVFRASVMGIVVIICNISGRNYNGINALFLSALIILIVNPLELLNVGFLLSFSAVLSILIFYPKFNLYFENISLTNVWTKKILLLISLTISAQIFTIPFILIYFHKLSIISIISNVIVVPVTSLILLLGLLTIFMSYFWFGGSLLLALVNDLLIKVNIWFVELFANNKFASVDINNFSYYDLFVYFIIILILYFYLKKMTKLKTKIIIIVLLMVNYIIYIKLDDKNYTPKNNLTVIALDVGQGDSFLIKFIDNKTCLIDAGNITKTFDAGMDVILPACKFLEINKLDYIFISHIDSDHYLGLTSIVNKIDIGVIYKPAPFANDIKDKVFEKLLIKNKIEYKYYQKESICISNAKIYFLITDFKSKTSNDKSGVVKLIYGKTSFLFTGDAGISVEKSLIDCYGSFLSANVLKAGHHGSKYSSCNDFLYMVKPEYTLISSGIFNNYYLPSKETINKLELLKSNILRTDKEGTIILTSTGFEIKKIDWK
ncbi:MAG: DNA internalization-related competence protein ComEC/Rec2 [bacterium]